MPIAYIEVFALSARNTAATPDIASTSIALEKVAFSDCRNLSGMHNCNSSSATNAKAGMCDSHHTTSLFPGVLRKKSDAVSAVANSTVRIILRLL